MQKALLHLKVQIRLYSVIFLRKYDTCDIFTWSDSSSYEVAGVTDRLIEISSLFGC